MKRGGIGVGGASIILVFAVLCLTVFALISYMTASSEKNLTDIYVNTTIQYYEADMLAEKILAEILISDPLPESFYGININAEFERISFSCPISDRKELYVEVALYDDTYDILSWRMRDSSVWVADTALPVWPGSGSDQN